MNKTHVYHPTTDTLTNPNILDYLSVIDPPLHDLFNKIGPESFIGISKTPYVALVGAVIGQIIRYTTAKSVRSNLYRICGTDFQPTVIDRLTVDQWNCIGLSLDKVEVLLRINQYLRNNNIQLTTAEDIRSLSAVKGIGNWTISTAILTSFLDIDEFPAGDLFIRKRIKKLYNLSKVPTISETKKLSERWRPYRSIVAWYLWRWF